MDKLIHHDQTGFIRGCLAADNVHRLLHIVDMAKSFTELCAVLSSDTEKASKVRLQWPYLWAVMKNLYLCYKINTKLPWPLRSQAQVNH